MYSSSLSGRRYTDTISAYSKDAVIWSRRWLIFFQKAICSEMWIMIAISCFMHQYIEIVTRNVEWIRATDSYL